MPRFGDRCASDEFSVVIPSVLQAIYQSEVGHNDSNIVARHMYTPSLQIAKVIEIVCLRARGPLSLFNSLSRTRVMLTLDLNRTGAGW